MKVELRVSKRLLTTFHLRNWIRRWQNSLVACEVFEFTCFTNIVEPKSLHDLSSCDVKEFAASVFQIGLPFSFVSIVVGFSFRQKRRKDDSQSTSNSCLLTKSKHSSSVSFIVEPLAFVGRSIGVEHSSPTVSQIGVEFSFVMFFIVEEEISVALKLERKDSIGTFV